MLFILCAWWDSTRTRGTIAALPYLFTDISSALVIQRFEISSPSTGTGKRFMGSVKISEGKREPLHRLPDLDYPLMPPLEFMRGGQRGFEDMDPSYGKMSYHQLSYRMMERRPPEEWLLVLPYWVLLVAVIPVWLCLMVAREWWRRKRAEKSGLTFHRSRCFRAGALATGVLLVSWWDSLGSSTWAGAGKYYIGSSSGFVSVRRSGGSSGTGAPAAEKPFFQGGRDLIYPVESVRASASLRFLRGRGLEGSPFSEAPRATYEENAVRIIDHAPREDWAAFLPHWFLLAATVIPWTGIMIWRTSRQKTGNPETGTLPEIMPGS